MALRVVRKKSRVSNIKLGSHTVQSIDHNYAHMISIPSIAETERKFYLFKADIKERLDHDSV